VVAAYTGLRCSELSSLTPECFDLSSLTPTVTVKAAYSKNRETAVLPLRSDVAGLLRPWIESLPRYQPIWPGTWSKRASRMIRRDLEAAGIPYHDAMGRVFDFHALRHHFLSMLARSGTHPKTAQMLARHSTITLTMDRYTHLGRIDTTEALEALPPLGAATVRALSGKVANG
jgi:integrase